MVATPNHINKILPKMIFKAEPNGFLFSLGFDFRNIFVKVYQIATVECHSIHQGKCLPWMLIRCGS